MVMTPIRYWSPTYDLLDAARSMDRLFDTFFGYGGTSGPQQNGTELPTHHLAVDVAETPEAFVLTASVPGFAPEQVEVTWHEGILTIWAKAEPKEFGGDWQWLRRERPWGNWLRRLQLPDTIRTDGIQASFENGLLTVSVPKLEKPEPVKIPVGGTNKQISS